MGALVVPGLPAINERLEELGIGHDRPSAGVAVLPAMSA